MNWLDYILIAFLGLSMLSSLRKGFAREVIGLIAAVLALMLGMWFYGTAGLLVEPFTGPGRVASLLGFLLVFVAVLIAGSIAGWTMKRFLQAIGLSIVDRLLGAIFGLLRGALIATAVLTAYMAFGSHPEGKDAPAAVVNSGIAPYLLEASRFFVSIAPMELKSSFGKQYAQVKAAAQKAAKDAAGHVGDAGRK